MCVCVCVCAVRVCMLRDRVLGLETAMVDSDVLSPAWTVAGGQGVEWRRASVAARTPADLGLQVLGFRV